MRRAGYAASYESQYTIDMSKVALMTQAVYAYRIKLITKMKLIPVCIVVVRNLKGSFI